MKTSRTTASAAGSTLLLILLLVVAALAAAGCSRSTAADTPPSPPSTGVAGSESTTSAQPAAGSGYIAVSKLTKSDQGLVSRQIFLVRPDGSGLRQLTHSRSGVDEFAWSPDGSRIAYLSPKGVWVVNADGSGQRWVGPEATKGGFTGIDWSPDGTRMVLTTRRSPDQGPNAGERYDGVAIMNADGSGFRMVVSPSKQPATYVNPVWAPDGRIYFSHGEGGSGITAISTINADGSGWADVTLGDQFSLSEDGRWLALFDMTVGRAVYMAANGHGRQGVFLEGKRLAAFGEGNAFCSFFGITSSWSPDGTRIAFASNGANFGIAYDLYIVGVDGSGLRKVPNTGPVMNPAWQPQ